MVLGAATRRSSIGTVRVTGLIATTVLLCSAAGTFGAGAAVAAPYPPTLPCSLSWSQGSAHDAVLVGNGYGTNQPLTVTLYPQARTLGATATNSAGSFAVPVDVAGSAPSSWVTASSPGRTCSVVPPGDGTGGSTSGPGAGSPSTGGNSTGGNSSGGNSSASGGANSGSGSAAGGSGSGSGTGGSGSGATNRSNGSAYPPARPTSASPSSGAPGTGTPSPSRSSTGAPAPNSSSNTVTPLGLPLTAVVVIAALLLLGGALGVLILTRRAG